MIIVAGNDQVAGVAHKPDDAKVIIETRNVDREAAARNYPVLVELVVQQPLDALDMRKALSPSRQPVERSAHDPDVVHRQALVQCRMDPVHGDVVDYRPSRSRLE